MGDKFLTIILVLDGTVSELFLDSLSHINLIPGCLLSDVSKLTYAVSLRRSVEIFIHS